MGVHDMGRNRTIPRFPVGREAARSPELIAGVTMKVGATLRVGNAAVDNAKRQLPPSFQRPARPAA